MDAKRFVGGTLVGGSVMFLAGSVIFRVVFSSFFVENAGAAADAWRDPPLAWALILGNLILAALITLAIGWSGAVSIAEGFKIGGIVGLLVWLGVNFILYGIMDNLNMTATIVDGLLGGVMFGFGGASVSAALARISPAKSS